jgi:hypothetical protein
MKKCVRAAYNIGISVEVKRKGNSKAGHLSGCSNKCGKSGVLLPRYLSYMPRQRYGKTQWQIGFCFTPYNADA